jgi:hypothetical protein
MNKAADTEIDSETGEIMTAPMVVAETGMVTALARAELDTQIATAKTYPRSVKAVINNVMSLATLDDQTSAECIYTMPRAGKPIRGASIRFAEILNQQWGNCRVDARVIAIDRAIKVIVAEGTFHDLETNSATRAVVQRRISDKKGGLYNDDLIVVTGNAACAIAKRNAILGGVPKAVWRKAYGAAERVVAGDIKTLATRRDGAIKAFGTFGVKPEQVFAAIGVGSIDEITLDHIPTLVGMFSSIKNGEATVEELLTNAARGSTNFERVANPLQDDDAKKPQRRKAEPAPATSPAATASPAAGTTTQQQPQEGGAQSTGAAQDTVDLSSHASSTEAASGDSAATADPLALAYERGQAARAGGHARKTIPGEYRDSARKAEANAWLAGFDGKPFDEGLL